MFSAVRVGPVWSCPQADQLSQQTPESTVLVPSRRCSSLRWPLQWSWPDNNNITSPHPDICTGLLLTADHCTAWHLRHGNDSRAALLHSSLSFASVCMNDVRIAEGGAAADQCEVHSLQLQCSDLISVWRFRHSTDTSSGLTSWPDAASASVDYLIFICIVFFYATDGCMMIVENLLKYSLFKL